jgi:hypothetical protein
MVQPPSQCAIQRGAAIRDHLVPFIRAASAREGMNGHPLLFMAQGFWIGYWEVAGGTRMEVWRQRRLMRIEWNDKGVNAVSFTPGDWEQAILTLREV